MEAYAKLIDRTSLENENETEKREFLITELPCSLGRVNLPSSESFSIVIDSDDILLSRQHAEIRWSDETEWSLLCLSKNGLFVDDHKYKKDEQAVLRDGSDIRLGNSKLIFVLPALSPGMMNNKRKRNENDLLAEADDGAADCSSPNPDPQEELAQEQGTSTNARMSYKEMIDSAFDSYELDLDEEGSVLQTELVDWIASKYYKLQDDSETKKQSLRKGLYSILMKHYERIGSEESTKRQKRGTIRWRTKQGIDSNV